jgi:hypothetical protein
MVRQKSSATFLVADGSGGLAPVEDLRFEGGDWPLSLDVPADQADIWITHLKADCASRGWQLSAQSQLEAEENSGTITINIGTAGQSSQLNIVWTRSRTGPLTIKGRVDGVPFLTVQEAQKLLEQVRDKSKAPPSLSFYRRGFLHYEGLPWCGELWLEDSLRLGPPQHQHSQFLHAPRVSAVDMVIAAISDLDANTRFDLKLRELSTFLSVVLGHHVRTALPGHAWTVEINAEGKFEPSVRQLGYFESSPPSAMPVKGQYRPLPTVKIARPDLSWPGILGDQTEYAAPEDTTQLWQAFLSLPAQSRDQFLGVGRAWQVALSLRREHPTASVAFMVVACEALKPLGKKHDRHNIYHVVEGLLGKPVADGLRLLRIQPQKTRSGHFHRAELAGSELAPLLMMSTFTDPSFDQARWRLATVTQAAIIEWLRLGGLVSLPALPKSDRTPKPGAGGKRNPRPSRKKSSRKHR